MAFGDTKTDLQIYRKLEARQWRRAFSTRNERNFLLPDNFWKSAPKMASLKKWRRRSLDLSTQISSIKSCWNLSGLKCSLLPGTFKTEWRSICFCRLYPLWKSRLEKTEHFGATNVWFFLLVFEQKERSFQAGWESYLNCTGLVYKRLTWIQALRFEELHCRNVTWRTLSWKIRYEKKFDIGNNIENVPLSLYSPDLLSPTQKETKETNIEKYDNNTDDLENSLSATTEIVLHVETYTQNICAEVP